MNTEFVRKQLAELEAMSRQVDKDDDRIVDGASARLEEVNRQIERCRPAAESGDSDAEVLYLALVQEAGHLNQMVGEVRSRASKS